ncbi:type II toxin-antitoxin system RatA family toxin [Elioraea sp.]|uniref:type II toxin-antitoxin system RatA family toxin n=1 Tax=Elioraea sp. TaxID=2185103 RepID=UPI0025C6E678|nr:type II toxin-antitoxin system RatA family toxin [Elioraea sp.]
MPTHAQKTFMPYRPDQLFDLVADVGRYPEFLPWCVGARIREKSDTHLVADLVIGFKVFRERFTSHVALDRPGHIHVRYEEGPFRYLNNHWKFVPEAHGTTVDFYVDFEFKSRILQAAIGVVFNEAVRVMVAAFERRARRVYGPTSPAPSAPPAPSPTG